MISQSPITSFEKYPSIMAQHEAGNLSSKYHFVPTTRVIDILAANNWHPFKAQEVRARSEKYGYQKHLIRFRQIYSPATININDLIPEIVLTNSHDGGTAFQICCGIFRLVCANGLMVADSTFASHRIKHMGFKDELVLEAIDDVVKTTPRIMNKVDEFKSIALTKDEQLAYAESAFSIKFTEERQNNLNLEPQYLLEPRRIEDREPTLWNTFNIVQEKFMRSGFGYATDKNKHRTIIREVKSISESIRLNKSLWMLTEKMAELKKVA